MQFSNAKQSSQNTYPCRQQQTNKQTNKPPASPERPKRTVIVTAKRKDVAIGRDDERKVSARGNAQNVHILEWTPRLYLASLTPHKNRMTRHRLWIRRWVMTMIMMMPADTDSNTNTTQKSRNVPGSTHGVPPRHRTCRVVPCYCHRPRTSTGHFAPWYRTPRREYDQHRTRPVRHGTDR
jgi:hypothetical protein